MQSMKQVLALVLAGGRVDELTVLTLSRPKSAVPFGGMYRVIDFSLSNLMHSGVERVGILSQYRSFSLINHVGIGSWWDFVGRDRGATMLLPSPDHRARDWYKGTADAVYQNLEFVSEQAPEMVLILSGDHIYQMDYRLMLNYHLEKNADLTVAFFPIAPEESSRFGVAALDDEDGDVGGSVTEYREKPNEAKFRWASLTIFLFKPDVLYDVVQENARSGTSYEFGRDIIPNMLQQYRVYGYKFHDYWGYARTIDEFWQTNMHLLRKNPRIDLERWQVRTNLDHDSLRDRPPSQISRGAVIENSIFHNGCVIDGQVHNSILFPGVRVEAGAVVRNSILFFDTIVHSGARLERTITDFDVEVGRECVVGEGESGVANRENPTLLKSGITVIGKDVSLPERIRIGKNCIIYPGLKQSHFREKQVESGLTLHD